MSEEKNPRNDYSLLIVIGNCILAVSAWTIGAYLFLHDCDGAGCCMFAMPLIYYFRQPTKGE